MDPGDVTQLVILATIALVFGRVGLAVARLIERRASGTPTLPPEAEDRLRALEEDCSALRRELAEVQERQDFAERVLLQDPSRASHLAPRPASDRIVTPK